MSQKDARVQCFEECARAKEDGLNCKAQERNTGLLLSKEEKKSVSNSKAKLMRLAFTVMIKLLLIEIK